VPASNPAPATTFTERVEVAVLKPSAARVELKLPGEVEGLRDALLASATGGLVERVNVRTGEEVRKGKALARVDESTHRINLDRAEAELKQAESDLARAKALGDNITKAQVEAAETRVTLATAALRAAKLGYERSVIRAPFDGVVADAHVEVGEVAPAGAPIVRLVQMDPVLVTVSVPDRDVVGLRPGTRARITADAHASPIEAQISRVSAVGDLKTRAFEAEIEVPNPDHRLLPGMIVTVAVSQSLATDSVIIPQDWLVTRLSDVGVFLDDDGVARWRKLDLGDIVRDQVVVKAGLSEADRVVITGHRDLADGDHLLIMREGVCCENGRAVFNGVGPMRGSAR